MLVVAMDGVVVVRNLIYLHPSYVEGCLKNRQQEKMNREVSCWHCLEKAGMGGVIIILPPRWIFDTLE